MHNSNSLINRSIPKPSLNSSSVLSTYSIPTITNQLML